MNIGINLIISPSARINTNDSPRPMHIAGIKFNIMVIFNLDLKLDNIMFDSL